MAHDYNQLRSLAVRVLQGSLDLEKACQDLAAQDASWMWDVCAGTQRWRGRADYLLRPLAKKMPKGFVLECLRMAIYQKLGQDRSVWPKVVSETVTLVHTNESEHAARFVNAILRRLELKEGDGAEYWSLPTWLWDQLCLERGVEWTRAFAQSCLERPVNTTVNQDGSVAVFQGIFHGDGFVQDISNQALVQEVIALQPRHVLDLCAAPGGKSLGLVQGGMTVTATDKHREPMLRSSVGTKVRVMGWEQVWADASLFADCVWIDAPCSAMGLIRRHPEIKWNRVMLDVEALVKVQTALLAQVWERLAPGALLVYSVCSVMKAEGEAVTAQYVPIKEWLYAPHLTGGDGMYAALMRKPA